MNGIELLDTLVGKENLHLVSLTRNGKIKILGNKGEQTDRVAKAFYNEFRRQSIQNSGGFSSFPPSGYNVPTLKRFSLEEVENLVKLGAIAAIAVGNHGNVYDFACGIPVASIAYNKLTSRTATAIDSNSGVIDRGRGIVGKVGANVNLVNSRVEDYMHDINLGPEDVVIASSLTDELFDYTINLLRTNDFTLILHGAVPGELAGFVERNFTSNGYDVRIAKNNALKNLAMKSGAQHFTPQQYVFLAFKS
ncbi:MAG: hypothetical protein PHD13_05115 [Methanocellales archaeon]|nr:hypothetical protein [Methanocellales archaeon]MDD3291889.1 hypothetical protein [Methanocellales archaeon]MDD5235532.1 hypothetical protein [Methanocellales archaeon]MDD5485151.1 hypothetical protein [Methanocellales archaeon]